MYYLDKRILLWWRLYSLTYDTEVFNYLLLISKKSNILNLFCPVTIISYLNIRQISLKCTLRINIYVSFQYDRTFLQARAKGIHQLHWCLLLCALYLILSSHEKPSKRHRSKFRRSLMETQPGLPRYSHKTCMQIIATSLMIQLISQMRRQP